MKSIYEFLLKSKTTTSTQDADYVDLGLPSGLLWARCNIGAKESYEYGDYFMWGSTEPNTNDKCDWKSCPFNNGNNDYDYDKDYFNSVKDKVCPNGILAPEYDAATVILGDEWRLPTDNDFIELIDNTEQEWVKNYQGSKINGMLFTSITPKNAKAAKANGAELFIPASGLRFGSSFYYRGSRAHLWSSSLYTNRQNSAKCLYFNDSVYSANIIYGSRYNGFCLRGVKNK